MDERLFGAQIRRARLYEDITQVELADRANISPVTLAKLETGQGSTLRTLIKEIKALDREDWLESLEPIPAVSPLALSRAMEGLREPQRASKRTQKVLRGGSRR
ncbi:helix-turn-helix domain-containing protein [Microbacterium algeriense]|uniref:helix-turn-helix domain-containing protein n=1 Tax=Microbacterium algeriense TaxID=2615184 RepID=UPI003D75D7D6